jgi:hypothetical protein
MDLNLIRLPEDEDMFLNRLDSIIEYAQQFEGGEDPFIDHLVFKLIESRMFYLAWIEGGY